MSEGLLQTRSLQKRFGRHVAISNCDIVVPSAVTVALVGPNGAGKTTLLQMLVGLTRPTAGSVTTLGLRPGRDAPQLRARVGYVAQGFPLFQDLTVAETLEFGRRFSARWDDEDAKSRLDRLQVHRRAHVGHLSGGQRAQVALTLGLAKNPDLLVLDEPTAGLDPIARRIFLDELREARDAGTAILISSHNLPDLAELCDYLVVLQASCVRYAGPMREVVGGSNPTPAAFETAVLDLLQHPSASIETMSGRVS